MPNDQFYRELVPSPPPFKRTDSDHSYLIHGERARRGPLYAGRTVIPGLQKPSLISSFRGSIDSILFVFPKWAVADHLYADAYKSVLSELRKGTKFVIVHHESALPEVEKWFADAGHIRADVTYVPIKDYVSITDWAEDAYVAANDAADGARYLLEPWEFLRGGDALIADAVEDYTDIRASQYPLIFQGGNCLIGDSFWLLGNDYFADSIELLKGRRAPVDTRNMNDNDLGALALKLFSDYLERDRKLHLIGTAKPIPVQQYLGQKIGTEFYLDLAGGGVGTFQPIFHIDMFITLVGMNAGGKFTVLLGSPSLGEALSGESSPQPLDYVYDGIAADLTAAGFDVIRNPLVHKGVETGGEITLGRLKERAKEPGGEVVLAAIRSLESAGAKDASRLKIREFHHVTWNNCLVENSARGKHVYLPTFGHGVNRHLEKVDRHMKAIWEAELGFQVHMLGDFNPFAVRQGVVHCIKKYIARGA